jgi:hypothetical protein
VIGVGNYAMLEFEDGVARLCASKKASFEIDTASQRRAAGSERGTTLNIAWGQPSPCRSPLAMGVRQATASNAIEKPRPSARQTGAAGVTLAQTERLTGLTRRLLLSGRVRIDLKSGLPDPVGHAPQVAISAVDTASADAAC